MTCIKKKQKKNMNSIHTKKTTILEEPKKADFSSNFCIKQLKSHCVYLIENIQNLVKLETK